jgi:uncharacterized protein (DUF952 family)
MSEAIFHITTRVAWASAQDTGEVAPDSLATEGFVHCSTEAQVPGSIERHFAGHDDLVLLRLRDDAVAADLRWDEGRPGELFPHVYRALRLTDVAEARSWARG